MQATFCLTLSVMSFVIDFVSSETNKESQQDEKVVLQTPTRDFLLDAVDGTWSHNSLFSHYSPASLSQGRPEAEVKIRTDIRQPPMSVTRLTKTYLPGFDPHFNQGFFKPVEKRHKPVTLIEIRKNGLFPRTKFILSDTKDSSEVAELQSPYNDISNFWLDEPGHT